MIALEVRKRLVQYYFEEGHEGEIQIALATGGYVPLFFVPETSKEAVATLESEKSVAPVFSRIETGSDGLSQSKDFRAGSFHKVVFEDLFPSKERHRDLRK